MDDPCARVQTTKKKKKKKRKGRELDPIELARNPHLDPTMKEKKMLVYEYDLQQSEVDCQMG
jgi:hypothetical protein